MFGIFNKKKNCKQCSSLRHDKLVKNPKELSTLIKKIKVEVAEGRLIALQAKNDGVQEEFHLVPNKAPWSDIILNYFKCSKCKSKFKLFADTYHGSDKNGWYVN